MRAITFIVRILHLPHEFRKFPVPASSVRGAVSLHDGGELEESQLTKDEELPARHGTDWLAEVGLRPYRSPLEAVPSYNAPASRTKFIRLYAPNNPCLVV